MRDANSKIAGCYVLCRMGM